MFCLEQFGHSLSFNCSPEGIQRQAGWWSGYHGRLPDNDQIRRAARRDALSMARFYIRAVRREVRAGNNKAASYLLAMAIRHRLAARAV